MAAALSAHGQHNLLVNPGAEEGATNGWTILQNGGDGWSRAGSPLEGNWAFITSFEWCRRYQLVDLVEKGFSPAYLDTAPGISVGESFKKQLPQDDYYYIRVSLLDADQNVVTTWEHGSATSPIRISNTTWTVESYMFRDYFPGIRYVYFEDGGTDGEYWAGWYGARMDGAIVTVEEPLNPRISNAEGATHVTSGGATLNGFLLSTGAAPASVSVYWGLSDGGTNAGDWDNEAHSVTSLPAAYATNVTGLTEDRTYFYRCAASNAHGHSWALDTSTFLTGEVFLDVAQGTTVEGGANGLVLVRRPAVSTNGPITVSYSAGGTATPGVDYGGIGSSVTIPTGMAETGIRVRAVDDLVLLEPPRHVDISLDTGPYIVGTPGRATVTVVDDDREELSRWRYRTRVGFPGYAGTEPVAGLPVLVVLNPALSGFSYDAFASAAGNDLRFANANETELLPYEIEDWNDAQSNSYVWTRVPLLDSTTNFIWAYWGNPRALAPPGYTTNGTTWSENFLGVWHFGPDEGTALEDATAAGRDGRNFGTVSGSGIASTGRRFIANENDYISLEGTPSSDFIPYHNAPVNVSCWIKPDSISPAEIADFLVCIRGNENPLVWPALAVALGENRMAYVLYADGGQTAGFYSTNTHIRVDEWQYMTAEFSGFRFYLTVDGRQAWSSSVANLDAASSHEAVFGSFAGGGNFYDGLIDEVRISSTLRSTEWVWAEMMTIASNSVFTAYGPVEERANVGTFLMVR